MSELIVTTSESASISAAEIPGGRYWSPCPEMRNCSPQCLFSIRIARASITQISSCEVIEWTIGFGWRLAQPAIFSWEATGSALGAKSKDQKIAAFGSSYGGICSSWISEKWGQTTFFLNRHWPWKGRADLFSISHSFKSSMNEVGDRCRVIKKGPPGKPHGKAQSGRGLRGGNLNHQTPETTKVRISASFRFGHQTNGMFRRE